MTRKCLGINAMYKHYQTSRRLQKQKITLHDALTHSHTYPRSPNTHPPLGPVGAPLGSCVVQSTNNESVALNTIELGKLLMILLICPSSAPLDSRSLTRLTIAITANEVWDCLL